ncbi:MAG: hypothetical protein ACK5MV_00420 [Aminipila sp.]
MYKKKRRPQKICKHLWADATIASGKVGDRVCVKCGEKTNFIEERNKRLQGSFKTFEFS